MAKPSKSASYAPVSIALGANEPNRHVALLKIQGKEFELTPIPLRSVRPFVIDEVDLSAAAEEEGFELNDKIEVAKFLKNKVRASLSTANPCARTDPACHHR